MSYLPPNPAILPDGQEVKVHGSEAFPFAVYCGIIPTFIPAYPLHYHEEMELIYCETGSGSITIDRATVTLHTGDVAVILPGQIHAIAAAGPGRSAITTSCSASRCWSRRTARPTAAFWPRWRTAAWKCLPIYKKTAPWAGSCL